MQIKKILVIEGLVQGSGYQKGIESLGLRYGVKAHIEIPKPYDVRIVCEGDERKVDQFVHALRTEQVYLHRARIVTTFRSSGM